MDTWWLLCANRSSRRGAGLDQPWLVGVASVSASPAPSALAPLAGVPGQAVEAGKRLSALRRYKEVSPEHRGWVKWAG